MKWMWQTGILNKRIVEGHSSTLYAWGLKKFSVVSPYYINLNSYDFPHWRGWKILFLLIHRQLMHMHLNTLSFSASLTDKNTIIRWPVVSSGSMVNFLQCGQQKQWRSIARAFGSTSFRVHRSNRNFTDTTIPSLAKFINTRAVLGELSGGDRTDEFAAFLFAFNPLSSFIIKFVLLSSVNVQCGCACLVCLSF